MAAPDLDAEARELVDRMRAEAGPPLAVSTLHPQNSRTHYMIFDTRLPDGRTLLVGKGRGGLRDAPDGHKGRWMSEIAREVARRLVDSLDDADKVLFSIIQDQPELRGRMQATFDLVAGDQAIMFLAPTDRMLALMTVLLGLEATPPPGSRH
jgi:hypothetical protein